MDRKYLARVAAAFLVVGGMTGCTSGAHSGSVEVEVRTMVPGAQGGSYGVKIIGADGDLITSQEVSVGSTYGIEGISLGWISVETTSGCAGEKELTLESPAMRVVIDGKNCIVAD